MIRVEEAIDQIVVHAGTQPKRRVSLQEAMGQVLAQEVSADIDSPPFDKSLMDGFALRAGDLNNGRGTLRRTGELLAGQVPTTSIAAGETIQIMTGAPIPPGADAVIMIEKTKSTGDDITFDDPELAPGQNIMRQALEFARGERLLEPGHPIGPAEAGLLASVGAVSVDIFKPLTLAILSTGNEIVPPSQYPGPGEIRNSNALTLEAAARRINAIPFPLGIAADESDDLERKITQGLASDVLVLSGGVSAGKRDLVPKTLEKLGVRCIFHGVAFKPGKPLWFGTHERGIVFGLPGNPVSVLACFEVFVRTAIRQRQAAPQPRPIPWSIPLAERFDYSTRRPTYHPARIEQTSNGPVVQPLSWKGSPDLRALANANGLLMIPAGDGPYEAGTRMGVLIF
jgi:molybdopterin molybdotransferase